MSGSLDPPLCVVSIARGAHMHACLMSADGFSVNILQRGQERISNHFAGRPGRAVEAEFIDLAGVPVLADAAATLVAAKAAVHPCGDHSLFVGAIKALRAGDGEPLLYHESQYGLFQPTQDEPPADIDPYR
jgi:flavin reductase (DIM6/NTAB) family NADH-FMN oxidoreductase RutF